MVNCDILWFISLILEGVLKGLWNLGAKGAPGWYPYFYRDRGKSLFLKWPFIFDGPHKFFDLCHCQKLAESLWKRCYLRKLDMNNFYYGHCSLTLIFKIPTWFSIKNSQCLSALLIILVLEKVKMHYWSVQSQLPGRVFSPSDIWTKLSRPLLLHFPFGMGTYVHHTKY